MIFLMNLPIGTAAIFLTPLVLADVRSGEHKRLDLAGVVLSTLAMLLLMLRWLQDQSAAGPGGRSRC